MAYVACPHTVTSPIADEVGMEPNLPCPERCELNREQAVLLRAGAPMMFVCGRGHRFVATGSDVRESHSSG